jgi:hypothetical protein
MSGCPMAMLRTRAGLGRADAALKHAHRRCPFLKRNPDVLEGGTSGGLSDGDPSRRVMTRVQPEAMKLLASRCPVMAPVIHSPGTYASLR